MLKYNASPIGLGLAGSVYLEPPYKAALRKIAADEVDTGNPVSNFIYSVGQGKITAGNRRRNFNQQGETQTLVRPTNQPTLIPANQRVPLPVAGSAGSPVGKTTPSSQTSSGSVNPPSVDTQQPTVNTTTTQPQQQTTNPTPQTPPVQKPYSVFNRIGDIWNMLIDRITLWWYQSRMKSGDMTRDQWATVQNAAKRLGSNRTAREWGEMWDKNKYGSDYFNGLHNFTQNLPHLHTLNNMATSGNTTGILGHMRTHGEGMKSAMSWGHKYGYVPQDQYDKFNKGYALSTSPATAIMRNIQNWIDENLK